ncbi:hypothetical protein RRF57_004835 [Xylaria bambusicola]|uniref:Uncharacterized protein n=1 Tax=Xylaria bambusicola TaxID=326684 RepID=A0AAN7YXB6_9PEZI
MSSTHAFVGTGCAIVPSCPSPTLGQPFGPVETIIRPESDDDSVLFPEPSDMGRGWKCCTCSSTVSEGDAMCSSCGHKRCFNCIAN